MHFLDRGIILFNTQISGVLIRIGVAGNNSKIMNNYETTLHERG